MASGVPMGNGQGKQALVRQNSLEGEVSTLTLLGCEESWDVLA